MTRLNARRMVSVRWRAHPMVPKPVDVEIAVASHGSKSSDAAARFRRSGPTAMRGFREIALHSTRFSWGDTSSTGAVEEFACPSGRTDLELERRHP